MWKEERNFKELLHPPPPRISPMYIFHDKVQESYTIDGICGCACKAISGAN